MLEIFCQENLNLNGKTFYREAVRGIIIENGKILLIYSEKTKDYKLPGGGVEKYETYTEALIREVKEEAGLEVKVEKEVLRVMEYDEGQFGDSELFKMLSIYYTCKIIKSLSQNLDLFEIELGFKPVWLEIDKAIMQNKSVLSQANFPRWTKRETRVLEYIKLNLM